jgi:hypothetical protein
MRSTGASLFANVAAGLAAFAVLLLAGEGVARIVVPTRVEVKNDADPWADFEESFAGSADLGWMPRPNFRRQDRTDDETRDFDARGLILEDSAQAAYTARPKVVFLGGSDTFGSGVLFEETFVEIVDRRLADADAINLGVPGYSSAQGVIVARKYLPWLKPAAAVIAFNFNDRRDSQYQQPDGPEQFQTIYRTSRDSVPRRLMRPLERSVLFRFLRDGLRRRRTPPAVDPNVVDVSRARPRVDERSYARNLSEIVAICRENHVRPFFLMLPDGPALTQPLADANAALARGDLPAGIERLERIVAANLEASSVMARTALASAYRRVGRNDDAVRVLKYRYDELDLDGTDPVTSDAVYREVMKQVARDAGVEVIDTVGRIGASSEAFRDSNHLSIEGNRIVGEMIADTLLQRLAADRDGQAVR